jgi:peptidoglycan/LPS O-acetylase OafA/YrhL
MQSIQPELSRSPASRWSPLHVCGIISYSLYLWRVILHLVSRGLAGVMPDPGIAAIAAMLSFVVAFISWLIRNKPPAFIRGRFAGIRNLYDREAVSRRLRSRRHGLISQSFGCSVSK